METPKIDKVLIENLELIDSKVINLSRDNFLVQIENLTIRFELKIDKNKSGMHIEKINETSFLATIYNYQYGEIRIFEPVELGFIDNIKYFFSVSCLVNSNNIVGYYYSSIIFNLFQEINNEI